jgi:pimeloyl-ACP methyl ester carboxylesterase
VFTRVAGIAAVVVASLAAAASAAPTEHRDASIKPTVVLVHGAWADASSWHDEIERLQKDGYPVVAPANPLRSLSGDSAYIASVLAQTPGPIVLVGHSYGGAVITNAAAGNSNVKALVYIDAFIPAVGETILQLGGADSLIPESIEGKGFPPFGQTDVDFYLKADSFRATFAADVSAKQARVMQASQRPLALLAGAEPTQATAWSDRPCWALVGLQDRAITPDAQRSMADRACHDNVVEIKSSHVSLVSHPNAVTDLIETAAKATR